MVLIATRTVFKIDALSPGSPTVNNILYGGLYNVHSKKKVIYLYTYILKSFRRKLPNKYNYYITILIF